MRATHSHNKVWILRAPENGSEKRVLHLLSHPHYVFHSQDPLFERNNLKNNFILRKLLSFELHLMIDPSLEPEKMYLESCDTTTHVVLSLWLLSSFSTLAPVYYKQIQNVLKIKIELQLK